MAEMPSNIAGSAAQAGYQAHDVAKGRDTDRAGQASAVNRQVKATDETDTTVETTDSDTAVFADSEGAGSQGRASEEPSSNEEPNEDAADAPTPEGLTQDDDGRLHLDLEA